MLRGVSERQAVRWCARLRAPHQLSRRSRLAQRMLRRALRFSALAAQCAGRSSESSGCACK